LWGDPIPTKGQKLWFCMFTIIPLRSTTHLIPTFVLSLIFQDNFPADEYSIMVKQYTVLLYCTVHLQFSGFIFEIIFRGALSYICFSSIKSSVMVGKQEAGVQCVCTHTGSVGMVRIFFCMVSSSSLPDSNLALRKNAQTKRNSSNSNYQRSSSFVFSMKNSMQNIDLVSDIRLFFLKATGIPSWMTGQDRRLCSRPEEPCFTTILWVGSQARGSSG
jgi:hypothetical protein